MRFRNWVFTAMMLISSTVQAELSVISGEVRLPPPGTSVAAAYLELRNTSSVELVLASISSSAARHTMFHRVESVNGVMKMRHAENIKLPANSTIKFSPGALHIMMMGVRGLDKDSEVDFEILFESGESIKFLLPVVAQ